MDEIKYMTHHRANFPSIFVLKKADNMIDFQKVLEGQVLDRDILSKQSKTGTESVTYSCKYQSPYYVPGCFKSTRHSEQEGQNSTLREGCELAPVLPTLNGLLAFLVLDPISKGTSVCWGGEKKQPEHLSVKGQVSSLSAYARIKQNAQGAVYLSVQSSCRLFSGNSKLQVAAIISKTQEFFFK